jgi:hypothetical protein
MRRLEYRVYFCDVNLFNDLLMKTRLLYLVSALLLFSPSLFASPDASGSGSSFSFMDYILLFLMGLVLVVVWVMAKVIRLLQEQLRQKESAR